MDKKTLDATTGPVVVNLGKKTKKAIKKLKKGEGKLVAELELAMDEVRARMPEADRAKLVPVVMFVERKIAKKGKLPFSPLSFIR